MVRYPRRRLMLGVGSALWLSVLVITGLVSLVAGRFSEMVGVVLGAVAVAAIIPAVYTVGRLPVHGNILSYFSMLCGSGVAVCSIPETRQYWAYETPS